MNDIEKGVVVAGGSMPFTFHPVQNLTPARDPSNTPTSELRAWYRAAITFNSLNNNVFGFTILPSILVGSNNGFILHGIQLEKTPSFPLIGPTPYVETLTETVSKVQTIEEAFGWDVAIAASGTTVAVTAPLASPSGTFEAGLIRTYEKIDKNYVHSSTLLPPDFDEPDSNLHGRFGHSVDLNANGDILLATAPFRTPPSSGTFAPSMYAFGKYDVVADFTSGRAKPGTSIYDLDIDGGLSASSTPWEVIAIPSPAAFLGAPIPPNIIGLARVINKHPDWFNSAPVAKWIQPNQDPGGAGDPLPSGIWEYRCTFDLDTSTHKDFVLEGYFGADNSVEDILLNGNPLSFTAPLNPKSPSSFEDFWPGHIKAEDQAFFNNGSNNLNFIVSNSGVTTSETGFVIEGQVTAQLLDSVVWTPQDIYKDVELSYEPDAYYNCQPSNGLFGGPVPTFAFPDLISFDNMGTLNAPLFAEGVTGAHNDRALDFGGSTSQTVSLGVHGTGAGTNFGINVASFFPVCSISLWVNLPTLAERGCFIKIGDNATVPGTHVDDGIGVGVGTTNWDQNGNNLVVKTNNTFTDTNINIGTGWHHIVCQFANNISFDVWIDGQHVAGPTTVPTIIAPTPVAFLGIEHPLMTNPFNQNALSGGFIDRVAIYANRAFTDIQISDIYHHTAITRPDSSTSHPLIKSEVVTAPRSDNQFSGYDVSVSNNGELAMVGLPFVDPQVDKKQPITYAGGIKALKRYGNIWLQKDVIAGGDRGQLGRQVAVSPNGRWCAVGQKHDSRAPFSSNDERVNIYLLSDLDNFVYPGAGVRPRTIGNEFNVLKSNRRFIEYGRTNFGMSVAMSDEILVVGAPNESVTSVGDNRGAVYVYSKDPLFILPTGPTTLLARVPWLFMQRLVDKDVSIGGNFGKTVEISSDGKNIYIGERKEDSSNEISSAGRVAIFRLTTSIKDPWEKLDYFGTDFAEDSNVFGTSIGINHDASINVVGAPRADSFRETGAVSYYQSGGEVLNRTGKAFVNSFRGILLPFKVGGSVVKSWGEELVFHEGPVSSLDIDRLQLPPIVVTNLLPESNDFAGAAWGAVPGVITVDKNQIDPFGIVDNASVIDNLTLAGTGPINVGLLANVDTKISTSYAYSAFVKKGTATSGALTAIWNNPSVPPQDFFSDLVVDFSTIPPILSSDTNTPTPSILYGPVDMGNDWYHVGYSIDGAINLVQESNAFDVNPPWTLTNTPIISQNQVDPFGVVDNAWTLEDDDATASETIEQIITVPVSDTDYEFSIFVKEGTVDRSLIGLAFTGGTTTFLDVFLIQFDSIIPKVDKVISTTSTPLIGEVIDFGNGWFKISIKYFGIDVSNNTTFTISLSPTATFAPTVGSILIFSAELAQTTILNDFAVGFAPATIPGATPIGGTHNPQAASGSTIFYGGQLEEGDFVFGNQEFKNALLQSTPGYVGHTSFTKLLSRQDTLREDALDKFILTYDAPGAGLRAFVGEVEDDLSVKPLAFSEIPADERTSDAVSISVDGSYNNSPIRENLFVGSNALGVSVLWPQINSPIVTKNEIDPFNIPANAWTLEDDDVTGGEGISQTAGITSPNRDHTLSLFVKEGLSSINPSNLAVAILGGTVPFTDLYNITFSGGVPSLNHATLSGPSTPIIHKISDFGNGWFRIGITYLRSDISDNTSLTFSIFPESPFGTLTATIIIFGAQFEQLSTLGTYLDTNFMTIVGPIKDQKAQFLTVYAPSSEGVLRVGGSYDFDDPSTINFLPASSGVISETRTRDTDIVRLSEDSFAIGFTGDNSSFTAFMPPSGLSRESAEFGKSVAISLNGEYAVAGAPGAISPATNVRDGRAFVYKKVDGNWLLDIELFPPISPSSPGGLFGHAVSIDDIGESILVAAPHDNPGAIFEAGAVYHYRRFGKRWFIGDKITPAIPLAGARFGIGLALSGDSTRLLVGADGLSSDAGGFYYYDRQPPATFVERQHQIVGRQPGVKVGDSLTIDQNGTFAMVGDPTSIQSVTNVCLHSNDFSDPTKWILSPDATTSDFFPALLSATEEGPFPGTIATSFHEFPGLGPLHNINISEVSSPILQLDDVITFSIYVKKAPNHLLPQFPVVGKAVVIPNSFHIRVPHSALTTFDFATDIEETSARGLKGAGVFKIEDEKKLFGATHDAGGFGTIPGTEPHVGQISYREHFPVIVSASLGDPNSGIAEQGDYRNAHYYWEDVGNDWFRVSITAWLGTQGGSQGRVSVGYGTASNHAGYQLVIYGAQVENHGNHTGPFIAERSVGPYVETTTTPVTKTFGEAGSVSLWQHAGKLQISKKPGTLTSGGFLAAAQTAPQNFFMNIKKFPGAPLFAPSPPPAGPRFGETVDCSYDAPDSSRLAKEFQSDPTFSKPIPVLTIIKKGHLINDPDFQMPRNRGWLQKNTRFLITEPAPSGLISGSPPNAEIHFIDVYRDETFEGSNGNLVYSLENPVNVIRTEVPPFDSSIDPQAFLGASITRDGKNVVLGSGLIQDFGLDFDTYRKVLGIGLFREKNREGYGFGIDATSNGIVIVGAPFLDSGETDVGQISINESDFFSAGVVHTSGYGAHNIGGFFNFQAAGSLVSIDKYDDSNIIFVYDDFFTPTTTIKEGRVTLLSREFAPPDFSPGTPVDITAIFDNISTVAFTEGGILSASIIAVDDKSAAIVFSNSRGSTLFQTTVELGVNEVLVGEADFLGKTVSPGIFNYSDVIDMTKMGENTFVTTFNDGGDSENVYSASVFVNETSFFGQPRHVFFIDPTQEDPVSVPDCIINQDVLVTRFRNLANSIIEDDQTRWTGRIAIPVQSIRRYGESFPEEWVSDITSLDSFKKNIVIDESFGPWSYPPRGLIQSPTYTGPGTSVQLMNFFAKNLIRTRANRTNKIQFGSVTKTGLPEVSFDNFALQEFDSNGVFAVTNHGISSINVQFGSKGYQTSYALKSHFSEFGQLAPLDPANRIISGNIIHPFGFDFQRLGPSGPIEPGKLLASSFPSFSINKGNLVVSSSVIGGGNDDLSTLEGNLSVENIQIMLPADDPATWLTPFGDTSDSLRSDGHVKIRRSYHFKNDNLSDWSGGGEHALRVDTSGDGFALTEDSRGSGRWEIKYLYKDFVQVFPNAKDPTVFACCVNMVGTDETDRGIGIVLQNPETKKSIFYGFWHNNEPGRGSLAIKKFENTILPASQVQTTLITLEPDVTQVINNIATLVSGPSMFKVGGIIVGDQTEATATITSITGDALHTDLPVQLRLHVGGGFLAPEFGNPGEVVRQPAAQTGALPPHTIPVGIIAKISTIADEVFPFTISETFISPNISDKMYLMVIRQGIVETEFYYSFDGVTMIRWSGYNEIDPEYMNLNRIGFGYVTHNQTHDAITNDLTSGTDTSVSFDWVAYKEAGRSFNADF
jgi:hypothetical protein